MKYTPAEKVTPKCPHCEKGITELLYKDVSGKGFFGGLTKLMFMCPHCHKILGFADSDHG